MVVVEYTYEEMRRLVDMPREKMIDSLSSLGAPSEYEPGVGKIITELTPNRPDWYSMEGLARALRAYKGGDPPAYKTEKSDYRVEVDKSVSRIRPYTVCAVIKGLSLDDERIRDMVLLQEKLLATLGRRVKKFGLGLYPLHAIEFPVRYTTMRPKDIRYVPLGHEKEMDADRILSEHKKGQQYGHLLQGHDRYPVFVDAKGRIMALIPIVNSAETGKVDESTKDIFIEVSGNDIHSCKAALNILCCTFADMGGTVAQVLMDYGGEKFHSPDLEPVMMGFDLDSANKILGLSLGEKEAAGLLGRMGYSYGEGKVGVPPYRADVMGQIDIVEDIAIAYGYNNFKPTIPDFFNPGEASTKHELAHQTMVGMGFLETTTFILTNKEKLGRVGAVGDAVEISNPGTVDFTVVRPTLIVDMLETFSTNKMKGLPQKFYEIGQVQHGDKTSKRLVFGVMDKSLGFSDFRGYLQTYAAETGLEFELVKSKHEAFEPGISCDVVSGSKVVGMMGKVSREVLEASNIPFEVYICEMGV